MKSYKLGLRGLQEGLHGRELKTRGNVMGLC
jgi:hypothetical protein